MTERVLQKTSHAHQVLTAKAGLLAPCSSTTVTPDSLGCSPANAESFCSVESYLKSLVISSASSRLGLAPLVYESLDDDKLTSPWKGGPLISEVSVLGWGCVFACQQSGTFDPEVPAGNAHCRRPGPTRSCRPHSADGIRFSNTLERPEQHLVGVSSASSPRLPMVPSNGFHLNLKDSSKTTTAQPVHISAMAISLYAFDLVLGQPGFIFSIRAKHKECFGRPNFVPDIGYHTCWHWGIFPYRNGFFQHLLKRVVPFAVVHSPRKGLSHEVLSPFGCQHWRCSFGCTKVSLQRTQGTSLVGSGAECQYADTPIRGL